MRVGGDGAIVIKDFMDHANECFRDHISLSEKLVLAESRADAAEARVKELESALFVAEMPNKARFKPYADTDAGLAKQVTEEMAARVAAEARADAAEAMAATLENALLYKSMSEEYVLCRKLLLEHADDLIAVKAQRSMLAEALKEYVDANEFLVDCPDEDVRGMLRYGMAMEQVYAALTATQPQADVWLAGKIEAERNRLISALESFGSFSAVEAIRAFPLSGGEGK
jgi:hypothetical protein